MKLVRSLRFVGGLSLVLVACGGAVAPNPFGSSSSSSGGSSNGGSSSSGSSSGSSGAPTCVEGALGALTCPACNNVTNEVCKAGKWTCPPAPPCAPPACEGAAPDCACPPNCSCGPACDPNTRQWTCTSSCGGCAGLKEPACSCGAPVCSNGGWVCPACAVDAGPPPFVCGSQDCAPGTVCTDTPSDVAGQPDTYQCVAVPAACANSYTCDCLLRVPGLETGCTPGSCEVALGGIILHCNGGG